MNDPGLGILSGDFEIFETVKNCSQSQDYYLTKFQGKEETYETIAAALNSNQIWLEGMQEYLAKDPQSVKAAYNLKNFAFYFDILTVRNRYKVGGKHFSSALKELQVAGFCYENIHCSFCRVSPVGTSSVYAKKWGS